MANKIKFDCCEFFAEIVTKNQAPNIVALTSPNNLPLPFKNFIFTKSHLSQNKNKKQLKNLNPLPTGQK